MSAGRVCHIIRGRQGERRRAQPFLGQLGSNRIRQLAMNGDDFVCCAGERSKMVDCRIVAGHEHPVAVPTADDRARGHVERKRRTLIECTCSPPGVPTAPRDRDHRPGVRIDSWAASGPSSIPGEGWHAVGVHAPDAGRHRDTLGFRGGRGSRVAGCEGRRQRQEARCHLRGSSDGVRRSAGADLRRPRPFGRRVTGVHRWKVGATAIADRELHRAWSDDSNHQRSCRYQAGTT